MIRRPRASWSARSSGSAPNRSRRSSAKGAPGLGRRPGACFPPQGRRKSSRQRKKAMKRKETRSGALRAILAELGATPAQARALIEAGRAARGGTDPPGAAATLAEFLHATDVLGQTADRVLGHVPEATEY